MLVEYVIMVKCDSEQVLKMAISLVVIGNSGDIQVVATAVLK